VLLLNYATEYDVTVADANYITETSLTAVNAIMSITWKHAISK